MRHRYRQLPPIVAGLSLAAFLLATTHCGRPINEPAAGYTLSQLQHDFNQVRGLIDRKHPQYFTDRATLDATFDKQYTLLREGMTSLEFFRVLAPAVSEVRCGHTRLSFPRTVADFQLAHGNHLPFDIRAFGEGSIFVARSLHGYAIKAGSEILSINGASAGDILTQIEDCLPSDGANETYKYWNLNRDFRSIYRNCVEAPETFEIVTEDPVTGTRTTRTVTARTEDEIQTYRADQGLTRNEPRPGILSSSLHPGFAVLRIEFFGFGDDHPDFAAKIDRFFRERHDRGPDSVILDLRGNDGGDPYAASHCTASVCPVRFRASRPTQA